MSFTKHIGSLLTIASYSLKNKIMKNRCTTIKQILNLAMLSLCLTACENLVEIDSPDNQLNTQDVFADVNTTKSALSTLYSNFRETPLFNGGIGLSYGLSKMTDDLDSFTQDDPLYLNNINATVFEVNSYWENAFTNLYQINAFIEGLRASNALEESEKKVFLGEAHFLRGVYYHYLCQFYGDIPYIKTTDYKANSHIGKTTYLEVLNLIETDLKIALEFMENSYRHPDRIYPNKAVVELVLAKNYLLKKRFDLAETYAENVLNNPLYELEVGLDKIFKKEARSTLWQMSPNQLSTPYFPTSEASNYIFSFLPPTNVVLSFFLLNAFSSKDLRLKHWVKEVTNGTDSYWHAYKYKNNSSNEDEFSIFYRLEEAYFIKAEALAYQEKVSEAAVVLNEIRTRRGLTALPTSLSKADFIAELLSEYQREFFTEGGHRFLDLKRNNRLQDLELVKPNWEAKHALLPIPESELLLNKNLKPQNYGY